MATAVTCAWLKRQHKEAGLNMQGGGEGGRTGVVRMCGKLSHVQPLEQVYSCLHNETFVVSAHSFCAYILYVLL